jgi:trk system potassium uptake protein TrkH
LSVRHEEAVAGLFSGEHRGLLFVALRRTITITVAAEAVGALVLAVTFWIHGDSFGMGLWRGVFTSVSAFCNAGFALQSDSLMSYQGSPVVLNTVAMLIIVGGISPAVIVAMPRLTQRRSVPMQVKVVLAASAALVVFGTVAFAAIEWDNSLAGMSFFDRIQNAWFQSVTFRTAGFNSVDFEGLRAATLPLVCAMMFVGGAPGGTAGGVKVTTMWIFFAAVAGALRGEAAATSFGRRIPHTAVYRAIAIMTISGGLVAFVLMGVFLTQDMSASHAVFEVFSATGTVGLSMGGTAELDGLGKVMIMAAMFLGRVGPLTAFLFLVERQTPTSFDQLEENLEVG